jgi:hypothetical protein
MAEEKDNPIWSLVIWGSGAVALLAIGLWCVNDGWFKEACKDAEFNRYAAPVCFLAAIWCVWRGIKEYKAVAAGTAEQGTESSGDGPAAPEDAPTESGTPPSDGADKPEG